MFNFILKHLYKSDKEFSKNFPSRNYYFYKHLPYTVWHDKVIKELNKYSLNNVINLLKYCDMQIKFLNEDKNGDDSIADVLKFGTSSLLVLTNIIIVAVVGNSNKDMLNLFLTTRGGLADIIFIVMSIILLDNIITKIYKKRRIFLYLYYRDLKEVLKDIYEIRSKISFTNL